MQDMILLGFLMDGGKTGYQVKKMMESSTSFFFNTSLGSIYPAFRKLEREGLVALEESIEDGRLNKIYSITPDGRKKFSEWLAVVPELSKVRDEALLKLFFFREMKPAQRRKQLVRYLELIRNRIGELAALKDRLAGLNVDHYQLSTLDFGISYYAFLLSWHQEFLEKLGSA
jgi:DNA-binding PadR family transcriptional regulator